MNSDTGWQQEIERFIAEENWEILAELANSVPAYWRVFIYSRLHQLDQSSNLFMQAPQLKSMADLAYHCDLDAANRVSTPHPLPIDMHYTKSEDGRFLAFMNSDQALSVWDMVQSEIVHTFPRQKYPYVRFGFSRDGNYFFAGCSFSKPGFGGGYYQNHEIFVWRWPSAELYWQSLAPSGGVSNGTLNSLALSANGHWLASAIDYSPEKRIIIWQLPQAKPHLSLDKPLGQLTFSLDGTKLFSSSFWNTSVFHLPDAQRTSQLAGGTPFVLEPNGRFAAAHYDKKVRLFNLKYINDTPRDFVAHTASITHIAWHPQGTHFATASREDTDPIFLWSWPQGEQIQCVGHTAKIDALLFTNDGSHLVASSKDKHIRFYRVSDGREVLTLSDYNATSFGSNALCFVGENGRYLINNAFHNNARGAKAHLWDLTALPLYTRLAPQLTQPPLPRTESNAGWHEFIARL